MLIWIYRSAWGILLPAMIAFTGIYALATNLRAADPTFVGSLATILEDDVAQQLQLSDETRMKLKTLAYEREKNALDLAIELKGATPDEKKQKLEPYVAESEKMAMDLLTPEQQEAFKKLQIKMAGLTGILDPAMAGQLNLADWQKEELSTQLKVAKGPNAGPRDVANFERFAKRVLSPSQHAKWEELAGITNNPETIPADQVVPPNREQWAAASAASTGNDDDLTMKFSFRYQPWGDVLDWFAEQADLSLVMDAPPPGTFNYTDGKPYTPTEAIDLLNSILLTKGYTLVRREKMLIVVNLEDGIPPNLVATVSMDDLDKRGEYELVSVLFNLKKMTAEEAEAEVTKLIGPQGAVVPLVQSRQIFVTETAGRLRTIRDMIQAVENPFGNDVVVVETKHLTADEILTVIRQLLGMEEGSNTAEDGSIRFASDTLGTKIFLTGKKDMVEKVQKLIAQVDVPGGGLGSSPADQLQLEVYPLGTLDPATTLQVVQTLLAGDPDIRVAIDENTGNLIVLSRAEGHATVRATLAQMQRDSKQIEVIQLSVVDPQVAVLSIGKLFGGGGEKPSANAPIVDADPITSQLLVRGTGEQVRQIKDLLMKMGEDPDSEVALQTDRGNVRTIPLSGTAAQRVLDELEMLWPTVSNSRIRVVRPSAAPSSARGQAPPTPIENPNTTRSSIKDPANANLDSEARWQPAEAFRFVDYQKEDADEDEAAPRKAPMVTAAEAPGIDVPLSPSALIPAPSTKSGKKPSDIVVMMGPSGLVIASDDKEALDKLESLIETLSSRYSSSAEYSVYYLRYVKADVASSMLKSILTGSSPEDGGAGGGSLMGDIASEMLGGGGGLMGSLMGLGGAGSSTSLTGGALSIIPDMRLNALVVQASVEDLDKIDQLLKIIDQPHSPEQVETKRTPRMIPVHYTNAQDMASIVQTVYADRVASTGNGQQKQPSPEDFIQALRGGRGGRGGGGNGGGGAQSEPEKMTIGVDKRSNSLVVSAPDPLFEEVKALVEELDQAGDDTNETMQVVQVRSSNPEAIHKALASLTGAQVTVNSQAANVPGNANNDDKKPDAASQNDANNIQQRMEMFNRIRQQMQQMGGGAGGPGGGRGGFQGGGGGRGGFQGGGGRGGR